MFYCVKYLYPISTLNAFCFTFWLIVYNMINVMQNRIFSKQKIVIMPASPSEKVVFNKIKKKQIKIDDNYKYEKNIFIRVWQFILYYIIAKPLFLIYGKCFLGIKVFGREKIKSIKSGAITVSNHVHFVDFSIATNFISLTKRTHIISNKDNFDVPIAGKLMSGYGVMPLPDTAKANLNFYKQVNKYLKKGRFIHLFPEASMWPYYNKLRPFYPGAFHFACKNNLPVIPYVIVFRKNKRFISKRPKISVYICNPVFANTTLPFKQQKEDLMQRTYDEMQKILDEHESFEFWKYVSLEEYERDYKNKNS